MNRTFFYMRISTKEERGIQKFKRQEQALERYKKENNIDIPERRVYKDDCSGKSFNRPAWKELEEDIDVGDTIVFKDIARFTREYDNGYNKYMELFNRGIQLIFLDNPTISTDYISNMFEMAEKQENRIAKKTLEDTIELLILVELDRVERERITTAKRIRDGILASEKKSGRPVGKLDKISDELKADIKLFLDDRTIKQIDLMNKYNISRNTLKKYIELVKNNQI